MAQGAIVNNSSVKTFLKKEILEDKTSTERNKL